MKAAIHIQPEFEEFARGVVRDAKEVLGDLRYCDVIALEHYIAAAAQRLAMEKIPLIRRPGVVGMTDG